jgi:hypothetical protein
MKSKSFKLAIITLAISLLLGSITACANSQGTPANQAASTNSPTRVSPAVQAPAAALILVPTSTATQVPSAVQGTALSTKQGDGLKVSLSSNPNPPIRGNNTFEAFITDAQGNPVSDAKVSFDIDMTNMSHGKNVITASSLGDGRYNGKVYFMMPGPWRLIVNIERTGQTTPVRFDFNVNWN